ncbi:hypothetical protein [Thermomonospora umbrina]|uniref:Uncharacterized protein n=1 Tax=Thermomonospora umbrina TaxID=111806 RepID=A0A3D9SWW5_9ACTN|nr:hypothetical protein [Thermomonospora umbrina]REF00437.1 hypothetical protein DFJ69_5973 [Thermomonospora umbrina]
MRTAATTSMIALACVAVLVGGGMLLAGSAGWVDRPLPPIGLELHRRGGMVYLGALVVAGGALLLRLAGEPGPALAVLATALIPALLVLPGSYTRDAILFPCVITIPVGIVVAARALLAPATLIAPVTVAAFAVVVLAGTYLLIGGLDIALIFEPTEENLRQESLGRVVVVVSGLALASAPVMLLLTGHKITALAVAPFALVPLLAVSSRLNLYGGIAYLLTGPLAVSATIYTMFLGRR